MAPEELAAEYGRALTEHYTEGRRGMRSVGSTALLVAMGAVVAFLPLWSPARRVLGVGLESTLPLATISALSIVHAAVAFRRAGVLSRWYRTAEDIESFCSVSCGVSMIYLSGAATSVFWIYFVLFIADAWNTPQYATRAVLMFAGGTVVLSVAFAARGAVTDAAVAASLGVLGVACMHAFASSVRHRMRAEAERRILRGRLERLQVERERDRIARDLHDGVAADLSALVWRARELKETVGGGEAAVLVDGLVADARRSLEDLREVLSAQRASEGTWDAFVAELRTRVERLCAASLSWEVVSTDSPGASVVPIEVRIQLLRIVQEGVRNTVQHARARAVRVEIERGTELRVCISDDGKGIPDDARVAPGRGLANISRRARELDGDASWSRAEGTRLVVRLPLHRRPEHIVASP